MKCSNSYVESAHYKNDEFALGLTISKVFERNPPSKIKAIIDGLKETDPDKCMTSAEK